MRKTLTYFFILLGFSFFAQQKVKIHVSFTNSYCNGARPTEEIMAIYNTPKNLSDFDVLLEGKKHIKVKTDSTGCFTKTLKVGIYKIYLTSKNNLKLYTNYYPLCDKMLHMPFGKLVVEKGKKEYELSLHFPCNPCEPNNKP